MRFSRGPSQVCNMTIIGAVMTTGLGSSLSFLVEGRLQRTSHLIVPCLSFPLEKQRSHPTGDVLSIPVIIDLHANQPNGVGELDPLGVRVAKAPCGGSPPRRLGWSARIKSQNCSFSHSSFCCRSKALPHGWPGSRHKICPVYGHPAQPGLWWC